MLIVIFGINATSDISKLLYLISRAVKRVKFETILKYHEWYFLPNISYKSCYYMLILHLLLFITRKYAIICVKRRPIVRRYIH